MRTPDEIKKGLKKCCNARSVCDECEFSNGNAGKWKELMGYALAYIQQLEQEREALLKMFENDGDCRHCKHQLASCVEYCHNCKRADNCFCADCSIDHNKWEFAGIRLLARAQAIDERVQVVCKEDT